MPLSDGKIRDALDTYTNLRYFCRYIGIGVINTIVGHGTIFGLMFLGVSPYVSNVSGYALGITVSYLLNKTWNFRSKRPHKEAYPRFLMSLVVAYLANIGVLFVGLDIIGLNKYVAQIIASVFYTGIGFLGSRYIAFSEVQ